MTDVGTGQDIKKKKKKITKKKIEEKLKNKTNKAKNADKTKPGSNKKKKRKKKKKKKNKDKDQHHMVDLTSPTPQPQSQSQLISKRKRDTNDEEPPSGPAPKRRKLTSSTKKYTSSSKQSTSTKHREHMEIDSDDEEDEEEEEDIDNDAGNCIRQIIHCPPLYISISHTILSDPRGDDDNRHTSKRVRQRATSEKSNDSYSHGNEVSPNDDFGSTFGINDGAHGGDIDNIHKNSNKRKSFLKDQHLFGHTQGNKRIMPRGQSNPAAFAIPALGECWKFDLCAALAFKHPSRCDCNLCPILQTTLSSHQFRREDFGRRAGELFKGGYIDGKPYDPDIDAPLFIRTPTPPSNSIAPPYHSTTTTLQHPTIRDRQHQRSSTIRDRPRIRDRYNDTSNNRECKKEDDTGMYGLKGKQFDRTWQTSRCMFSVYLLSYLS